MPKILSHIVHKKILYTQSLQQKYHRNRLISIDTAVNSPCCVDRTPLGASVRKFNGFYIVFGPSPRQLRAAKEAFCLLLNCAKRQIYSNVCRQPVTGCVVAPPLLDCLFLLKWAIFGLTSLVKIGYNVSVFRNFISFILRIWLIVALWALIWRFVEPRTQLMRILRAALLLLGLLVILALVRITAS